MAQLGTNFNAEDHDTSQREFGPVEGDCRLEVIESDVAKTSAGTGTVLKLVIQINAPDQYKGRKIWTNINIENPNATAQEIGQKELASLCRAIGVREVSDSEELHFKEFTAKVGMSKERKDAVTGKTYDPRPEIKRYYFPDLNEVPEPKAAATAAAAAPANDNASTARQTGNGGSAASKPAPAAKPAQTGKARPWAK